MSPQLPTPLLAVLLLTALALAREAKAQAWTQPPGHAFLKLAYGASTAAQQYTFDGRRKPYADDVVGPAYFDRSLYLYGELGLVDGLTLSASVPYKRVTVNDTTFRYDTAALGDVEAGLRVRLPSLWGVNLASNLRAALPTGYVRNLVPAPGAGQVDLTATVDAGRGLGSWAYVQGGVGYRMRTGIYGLSTAQACQAGQDRGCGIDVQPDLGDEVLGRLEIGARPAGPVLLQLLGEVQWSLTAPAVGFSVSQPIPTQRRAVKVGAGVNADLFAGLGVSAQGFFTPWGQNTVRSLDLFVGVYSAFDAWGG